MDTKLKELLERAFEHRRERLTDEEHFSALRLFNGFTEGAPGLAIDLYASSLLIHDLGKPAGQRQDQLAMMMDLYRQKLPWLEAVILKTRHAESREEKCGRLLFGEHPAEKVKEHSSWYALDLLIQQDAGLYLDTGNLRKWLIENMKGRTVLNTFAYTGSLGVAALAGGAAQVTQSDRKRGYLAIAEKSCALNGFPPGRSQYLTGDFFATVAQLKRRGKLFDCVILDPPFFSAGGRNKLEIEQDTRRLVNKVRPLAADGGWLVSINNALFLSGQDYLAGLETLCADGYLQLEEIIPVPQDFCGYGDAAQQSYPADPAPFNHPTKIAVLNVRRKVQP